MTVKSTLIAASIVALTTAALADDAHHPADAQPPAASELAPTPQTPRMQMGEMQKHMNLMREQMMKWHATSDPKERERLMDEHMRTMQESMPKMQSMMERMR